MHKEENRRGRNMAKFNLEKIREKVSQKRNRRPDKTFEPVQFLPADTADGTDLYDLASYGIQSGGLKVHDDIVVRQFQQAFSLADAFSACHAAPFLSLFFAILYELFLLFNPAEQGTIIVYN